MALKARFILISISLLCAMFALCIPTTKAAEIRIAGFSFSDELGGFRLLGVSGNGTRSNPFVIEEEILEVGPATLLIRRIFSQEDHKGWHPNARRLRIYITKSVANKTGKVWSGFHLELRQILNLPSTLEDGLSFDQIGQLSDDVSSNRFTKKQRIFEPSDRIKFYMGHVDPKESFSLSVPITDTTPNTAFYLIQHPEFLLAWHANAFDFE
ncbi:MAG: hypothetical protein AAGA53_08800 [Pseudomonadota bacterium]